MSALTCGCDIEAGWTCRVHAEAYADSSFKLDPNPKVQLIQNLIRNAMEASEAEFGKAFDKAEAALFEGVYVSEPEIKNSGVFETSQSGMKRDANPGGAIDYSNILHGPMYDRWASHLTKAKAKYPDAAPGTPNWTLGNNIEDLLRFRESAFRHLRKWMRGDTDEDHAAAVFFNINGAEYVLQRIKDAT